MHPRKIIREAFKVHMIGQSPEYATPCQDRVYDTRTVTIDVPTVLSEEGPVGMVYVRKEHIKEEDYPRSRLDGGVKVHAEVVIELICKGTDNDADDMAEAVDALFENFEIPGMPATEILLMETEIEVSSDFDPFQISAVYMVYDVCYWKAYRAGVENFDPDEELWPGATNPIRVFAQIPNAQPDDVTGTPDAG